MGKRSEGKKKSGGKKKSEDKRKSGYSRRKPDAKKRSGDNKKLDDRRKLEDRNRLDLNSWHRHKYQAPAVLAVPALAPSALSLEQVMKSGLRCQEPSWKSTILASRSWRRILSNCNCLCDDAD